MATYNVDRETGDLIPVSGGTLYADNPVGTILPYGGSVAPAGWFICDGSALNRTTYAELFSVIGTKFGVGDGSTTFNIPDMREMVPRGAGTQSLKTVGAHNAKNVGEFQDDRIEDHWHRLSTGSNTIGLETTTVHAKDSNIAIINSSWISSHTADYALYGTTLTSDTRAGTTTEVKSIGVNYIIKATRIAVPADFVNSIEDTLSDMGIGTILTVSTTTAATLNSTFTIATLDLPKGKWIVSGTSGLTAAYEGTWVTVYVDAGIGVNDINVTSNGSSGDGRNGGGLSINAIVNNPNSGYRQIRAVGYGYAAYSQFARMAAIKVA